MQVRIVLIEFGLMNIFEIGFERFKFSEADHLRGIGHFIT